MSAISNTTWFNAVVGDHHNPHLENVEARKAQCNHEGEYVDLKTRLVIEYRCPKCGRVSVQQRR